MQMLPIIANTSFKRIGTIDDYVSFIWSRRYFAAGDFELTVAISAENTELLQKDYYIMRDDADDVGIIENIKLGESADGNQLMTVSGRFLVSILARRIIATQIQVSGTVENCVKQLINANAIAPNVAARRIPNLQYGTFTNAAKTMQQQFTGQNLLEAIQEICESNGCGLRIILTNDNKFSFYLYDGVDRSYNQETNPYVIFSNEFDNLDSSEYQESYESIITDVLVAGEGEGTARKTVWASKANNSGLNRYESYQDARNSSTNDGEISDAVYYDQLRAEGKESITNFAQAFAGEVNWNNYDLGNGVDIGDIVVIENTRWQIGMNARIIEIIESVNESGVYSAIPTFAYELQQGEPRTDDNGYILTETRLTMLSENDDALLLEDAVFNPATSPYDSAKRISELAETQTLNDSDFIPAATPNNATKRIAYSSLKSDLLDYDKLANKPSIEGVTLQYDRTFGALGMNAMTNTEIEALLN